MLSKFMRKVTNLLNKSFNNLILQINMKLDKPLSVKLILYNFLDYLTLLLGYYSKQGKDAQMNV